MRFRVWGVSCFRGLGLRARNIPSKQAGLAACVLKNFTSKAVFNEAWGKGCSIVRTASDKYASSDKLPSGTDMPAAPL